jgi:O-antigen/teichoic acid export membrane protein
MPLDNHTSERKSKSILHNLVSMTGAELLTRIASYTYFIHLSHTLGVEGIGMIATAVAFVDIFIIIISHGLDVFAISEISRDKKHPEKTVSPILTIKLLVGIALYLILAATISFSDDQSLKGSAILIAGLHIFGRGVNGKWIYQGLERMNIIAVRQIISSILLVAMVFMFVTGEGDILVALWIQVGVEIFNTMWTFFFYWKEGYKLKLTFDWLKLGSVVRAALPFGAYFLLVSLYNVIDKNMIGFMREDFEYLNGILDSGVKIATVFMVPTFIIQNVYFPRFSTASTKEEKQRNHTDYIRLMSVFMSIGMGTLLFIPEINRVILPSNFAEIEQLLPYYGAITLIIYSVLMFTNPLMAWGYQKSLLLATGLGAVANISANALLIPDYGIYGAVRATILAELCVLTVSYILYRREGLSFPLRYPLISICIGIGVYGGWSYLSISGINLIFVTACLTLLQMLLLWLFRVIDKDLITKLAAN